MVDDEEIFLPSETGDILPLLVLWKLPRNFQRKTADA
jgi:hypothetical protein